MSFLTTKNHEKIHYKIRIINKGFYAVSENHNIFFKKLYRKSYMFSKLFSSLSITEEFQIVFLGLVGVG